MLPLNISDKHEGIDHHDRGRNEGGDDDDKNDDDDDAKDDDDDAFTEIKNWRWLLGHNKNVSIPFDIASIDVYYDGIC